MSVVFFFFFLSESAHLKAFGSEIMYSYQNEIVPTISKVSFLRVFHRQMSQRELHYETLEGFVKNEVKMSTRLA